MIGPSFAEEGPVETGPNFNNKHELPKPLPPDFNECVTAVTYPDFVGKYARVYTMTPPLTLEEIRALNAYRDEGAGKLLPCKEEDL